jgi:hypothetical protein
LGDVTPGNEIRTIEDGEASKCGGAQWNACRSRVYVQTTQFLRSEDVRGSNELCQQPYQRDLRQCRAFCDGNLETTPTNAVSVSIDYLVVNGRN